MRRSIVSLALLSLSAGALAADPAVYPAQGQSAEQQSKDEYECYSWAKSKTGFDAAKAAAPAAPAPAPSQQGRQGRRILGGALAGAVIGEIVDDEPTKGAMVGAAGAGIFGGMKRRQAQARQQQAHQQSSQAYDEQREQYNVYWSACLEGRGYTVR